MKFDFIIFKMLTYFAFFFLINKVEKLVLIE